MKIFQQALSRAKEEGKIDSKIIPWEEPVSAAEDTVDLKKEASNIPFQLSKFSNEVLNDFQRVIENIRSLVTKKDSRVIGVAGVVPDQGSSTVTALLSLITAGKEDGYFESILSEETGTIQKKGNVSSHNHRVLLIDTQVRNPSLHRMFEIEVEGGLSELLYNELPLDDVVREIESSYLQLITSGEKNDFRYTQAHLDKLKSIVDSVKSRYEFVFLDIPPILSFAEGIAISRLCDGVILVVSAGKTRLEVIQEAKRSLEMANIPLLGAVLNRRKYYIPDWIYKRL